MAEDTLRLQGFPENFRGLKGKNPHVSIRHAYSNGWNFALPDMLVFGGNILLFVLMCEMVGWHHFNNDSANKQQKSISHEHRPCSNSIFFLQRIQNIVYKCKNYLKLFLVSLHVDIDIFITLHNTIHIYKSTKIGKTYATQEVSEKNISLHQPILLQQKNR